VEFGGHEFLSKKVQHRKIVIAISNQAAEQHNQRPVSPIDLLITSFMISLVPPYMRCTRESANARAIGYSHM
jgi:hypothetical protein